MPIASQGRWGRLDAHILDAPCSALPSVNSLWEMDAVLDLKHKRLALRKIHMSAPLFRSSEGRLPPPVADTSRDEPEITLGQFRLSANPGQFRLPNVGRRPIQAVGAGSPQPDTSSPEPTKETPSPKPPAPPAPCPDAGCPTVSTGPSLSTPPGTSSPRPLEREEFPPFGPGSGRRRGSPHTPARRRARSHCGLSSPRNGRRPRGNCRRPRKLQRSCEPETITY